MRITLILILAKAFFYLSRWLGIGSGLTWPGHLVLFLEPHFLERMIPQFKKGVCLVSGTNGKTTTTQALAAILRKNGWAVVTNASGANLPNGLASALVTQTSWRGEIEADIGVFEVDEAAFPEVLRMTGARVVILLNLFRDQLDRYGEVNLLLAKWGESLANLAHSATIFINGDDPALAFLGESLHPPVLFFGLSAEGYQRLPPPHHADSLFCLNCNQRLDFRICFFSHLGKWSCRSCGHRNPTLQFTAQVLRSSSEEMDFLINGSLALKTELIGLYNVYNLLAVVAAAQHFGIRDELITGSLSSFSPRFGRQERLTVEGRLVKIFLSKNPAGFNENLRLISSFYRPEDRLVLVLNDGIADGRDVSWIYDVDFEDFPSLFQEGYCLSGRRALDLALRLKYAGFAKASLVSKDLAEVLRQSLSSLDKGTLYVLPTYTAMLAVRRILTGRSIGKNL